jgi:hydroxymethylpyrimidine pyrophosphatase-like HAD family hydrolase
MSLPVNLSTIIDGSRLQSVRLKGALILDVDDTLLAREGASSGTQETFDESAAAALLPEFLRRGFNLCLITGHGWQQLESRLVGPLVAPLRESGNDAAIAGLRIYANRGATKIIWHNTVHKVDEVYGTRHELRAADVPTLRTLLQSLAVEFEADVTERGDVYRETFPRFNFATLPARVDEREGAVLVLRPIPASTHAANADYAEDPRARLYERGVDLLRQTNLSDDYALALAGRSSIEITRRSVSKELAMRDLIVGLSKSSDESADSVEESLIYIGDEFFRGGNDFEIPLCFPRALCLSVAEEILGREIPAGVVQLARATGAQGTAAAEAVLTHLLNLSARA